MQCIKMTKGKIRTYACLKFVKYAIKYLKSIEYLCKNFLKNELTQHPKYQTLGE